MRFDIIHRYNDEIKRIDKALDDLKKRYREASRKCVELYTSSISSGRLKRGKG